MRAFLLLPVLVASASFLVALPSHGEADANPVLKPNDLVKLQVFDEPDLTTEARVLKSGEVVLPLINTVKIGGLTVSQANDAIRNLYAQDYLVDPKITLTVGEYSQDFISVIGAVKGPGQFPMPASGKFDLSAAIASAGGLGPDADVNRIVLTRASGVVSTHTLSGTQDGASVALQPGDRVVVQQSPYVNKSVTILGHVQKAGPIAFPLDGRLDIINAIAQAGGFTELADKKKVVISRKGKAPVTLNLKDLSEKGDQRYALQPDDTVTVGERFF